MTMKPRSAARHRVLLVALGFVVALLTQVWTTSLARADEPLAPAVPAVRAGAAGTLVLRVPGGGRGPLVLTSREGAYGGEIEIANTGAEPLVVSRVAVRGDDDDVRSPPKVAVRFTEGGGTTVTVAPHASKRVLVTWTPDKEPRLRQMFGHVIVTSSDDAAGEAAMGVRASLPDVLGPLADHALSLLVFLPLLGVLAIALSHFTGKGSPGDVRWLAIGITSAEVLLALAVFHSFNGEVTRADGNDGFQMIDRVVWIRPLGVEYFVGVDGTSVGMILLAAIVAFVGAIASFSVERDIKAYFALYLAACGGLMGVFVALDLVLFFVFWQTMLVPLYFLIGAWGRGARREYAASKLVVFGAIGSAFLLLAIVTLHQASDPAFLVDGSRTARSFAIPDLMRVSYNAKHLTVLGMSLVKVTWVSLFVAFAIALPMFPLHTWFTDALAEAPGPVALLLGGVVTKLGAYGLLRLGFGILPEAARWAAGAMVSFGVVGILYGGLCALAEADFRRRIAYATLAHMGYCLVGLGSLTPQGISGCLVQMFSHGIVIATLLFLAGSLEDRFRTRDLTKLGGLSREAPLLSVALGIGLLASLGLPGLSGFWGELLAILGAFPTYRVVACLAAGGAILAAASHLQVIERVCLGALPAAWKTSPALEPFGGNVPELTARESAALLPLLVLTVVLGLWPVPLLSAMSGTVKDTTALVNPPGPDQIALLTDDRLRLP
jgi:NADH-quinone oxidoreductase subunit M